MQVETPSAKIIQSDINGKEVVDSKGRRLRLREPDALDMYDLWSAIGEDTRNQACMMLAIKVLYVATIDGQVLESPKSLAQFRANLKRLDTAGINAVDEALQDVPAAKTDKEMVAELKK